MQDTTQTRPAQAQGGSSDRGGSIRRAYLTVLVILVILPVVIAWSLIQGSFRPQVSEDFLFLYFGVTSAVGVGAWSTLMLVEDRAKRPMLYPSVLTNVAALLALVAALEGTANAAPWLDLSISFLSIGIGWIVLSSVTEVMAYERRRERRARQK